MVATDKLLQKLENGTIKKAEAETLLKRLGFTERKGKGSHFVWEKAGSNPIVIATHDKDLKRYQMTQIRNVISEIKGMEGASNEGEES